MRIELLADLALVLVVFLNMLDCYSQRLVVKVFDVAIQVEVCPKHLWALVTGKDSLFFFFLYSHFWVLSESNLDLLILLFSLLHV